MMIRKARRTAGLLGLLTLTVAAAWAAAEDDFESIFNGQDLTGWVVMKAGHGTEAIWEVIDGVLTGRQNPPGAGGVIGTETLYGDFEVVLETNPQWPMDSGLFLRGQEGGKAYQITIDYRGGEVGTLYAEGCGGWLQQNKDWEQYYKKDDWNEIRARIVGNPPKVEAWLNGTQLVDFQDTEERLPDTGRIAVQVHRGDKYRETVTRFRNLRVKVIEP